jgi:hypothetical protein
MIQISDESASGDTLLCVDYSLLFKAAQGLSDRSAARRKLLRQGSLVRQSVPNLELACQDGFPDLLEDFI